MKNYLNFKEKKRAICDQELLEMAKVARKERDSLLKERPQLKGFQKEIDRRLQNAGGFESRMGVLGIMIAGKLTELQQQLSHLLSQIQLIDS